MILERAKPRALVIEVPEGNETRNLKNWKMECALHGNWLILKKTMPQREFSTGVLDFGVNLPCGAVNRYLQGDAGADYLKFQDHRCHPCKYQWPRTGLEPHMAQAC